MNKIDRCNFVIKHYKYYGKVRFSTPSLFIIDINDILHSIKNEIYVNFSLLISCLKYIDLNEIIPISFINKDTYFILYYFSKKKNNFEKKVVIESDYVLYKKYLAREKIINTILNE